MLKKNTLQPNAKTDHMCTTAKDKTPNTVTSITSSMLPMKFASTDEIYKSVRFIIALFDIFLTINSL